MDLRVVKTEKIIREAFLKLREEQPLEKIKVKDICDQAMINKSTFYKHYTDVFDLSDCLENEFISGLIEIEEQDSLFRDPEAFFHRVYEYLHNQNQEGLILFRERVPVFWEKFSGAIVHLYHETGGEDYATALLFVMGGLAFNRFPFEAAHSGGRNKLNPILLSYIRAIGDTLKQQED